MLTIIIIINKLTKNLNILSQLRVNKKIIWTVLIIYAMKNVMSIVAIEFIRLIQYNNSDA